MSDSISQAGSMMSEDFCVSVDLQFEYWSKTHNIREVNRIISSESPTVEEIIFVFEDEQKTVLTTETLKWNENALALARQVDIEDVMSAR